MWRFQQGIGDEHDLCLVAVLDTLHPVALFIQQERCDFHRQLRDDFRGPFLARLFTDQSQNCERQRLDAADRAEARTARTGLVRRFANRRPQALARHLEQAEAADLADLDARAVLAHGVAQPVFDFPLVFLRAHVDKVDNDQAAEVANAQLARDFVGCLEVGIQRGRFDVAALGGAGRVDVDGHQRLGMVDHDAAAGRQVYRMRKRGLDLRFDLEAREQRYGVFVKLQLLEVVRHGLLHVLGCFLERRLVVDQDLADIVRQVVAQGAYHRVALAINEEWRRPLEYDIENCRPDREKVFEVPGEFFGTAIDSGGAQDDAHAIRYFYVVERLAREVAVVSRNASRYAAGARLVGLQHDEAAGKADEGRQCRALVAALFLVDLDDDVLAFLEHFLDIDLAALGRLPDEILARDFFQRQEAVTVGTVINERGFETWLDARNLALVDIGFFSFARRCFDVEVVKALAVDHRHAQLFFLSCIDKHSFHVALLGLSKGAANRGCAPGGRRVVHARVSGANLRRWKVSLFPIWSDAVASEPRKHSA